MQSYIPVLFVITAIIFIDPLMLLMPSQLMMVVMVAFFVLFSIYTIGVWKEQPYDERENIHRLTAGHIAYLVGASISTLGILYQAITLHDVDSWLVAILVSMVISKTIMRHHLERLN